MFGARLLSYQAKIFAIYIYIYIYNKIHIYVELNINSCDGRHDNDQCHQAGPMTSASKWQRDVTP